MSETQEFVYVTYIKTTPEALWEALTKPEFIKTYWGGLNVSVGSKAGEPLTIRDDSGAAWDEGIVLAAEPPFRLSYTFHPVYREEDRALNPSRVDILIEPLGETVRLTLTHDQFDPRGGHLSDVSRGWPSLLSGLKSLVETGSALGMTLSNMPPLGAAHDVSGRTRTFVTYVKAPATRVWEALTDGEASKKYMFGRRVESDWKVGSKFNYWLDEGHGLDVSGEILECDPPHKLVVTWQVVWMEEFRNLPPAKVTYLVEDFGYACRLTVTEEVPQEVPEKYLEGGKKGWPMILSGLKTLLETGEALPPVVATKEPEPENRRQGSSRNID